MSQRISLFLRRLRILAVASHAFGNFNPVLERSFVRGELHDPVTLKAFLIRSVAEQEIRLDAVDAIVNAFNIHHERDAWVEALGIFARTQVTTTSAGGVHTEAERIDASRAACELGDYDAAFAHLLECKPSTVVVRQLLACSYEIDTLEASRRTLAFMEACPEDIRNEALSMRASRHIWDALTQEAVSDESSFTAEEIPDGWITWIERLNKQARGTPQRRLQGTEA